MTAEPGPLAARGRRGTGRARNRKMDQRPNTTAEPRRQSWKETA